MKQRYYTDKEIKTLTDNCFVSKIEYKRRIEYDVVFKLWCVMMRKKFPELTGKEIFRRGGFDIDILHESLPYRRISVWLKNYDKFGLEYFINEREPYHSLEKPKELPKEDLFKLQLMKVILKELKELENVCE